MTESFQFRDCGQLTQRLLAISCSIKWPRPPTSFPSFPSSNRAPRPQYLLAGASTFRRRAPTIPVNSGNFSPPRCHIHSPFILVTLFDMVPYSILSQVEVFVFDRWKPPPSPTPASNLPHLRASRRPRLHHRVRLIVLNT